MLLSTIRELGFILNGSVPYRLPLPWLRSGSSPCLLVWLRVSSCKAFDVFLVLHKALPVCTNTLCLTKLKSSFMLKFLLKNLCQFAKSTGKLLSSVILTVQPCVITLTFLNSRLALKQGSIQSACP